MRYIMTKEEAIERLVDLRVQFQVGIFTRGAIDMAIEALHREEAEAKGWCHRIRPKGEMREPTEEERASVKRYIDSISADVVAVVRCKDCRHHGMSACPMWEGSITDDYMWCYFGERVEP